MLHACRFLTDEGMDHLRTYLNLPSEIVPATLKKSTRPLEKDSRPPRRFGGEGGDRPPRTFGDRPPREGGYREGYRSSGGFGRGADKVLEPPGSSAWCWLSCVDTVFPV